MVELSRSLAHYFLNRLPEDDVCHWDLALLGTDAVRDSSAAAITACGLLELVNALPALDGHRAHYEEMALRIVQSLTDNYLATDDDPTEGLLKHSVYHMGSGKGVDQCCSWGDYFYLEALVRLRQTRTRGGKGGMEREHENGSRFVGPGLRRRGSDCRNRCFTALEYPRKDDRLRADAGSRQLPRYSDDSGQYAGGKHRPDF